jgi:hypothetical protein
VLKTSMMMLTAMVLAGASAVQVQAKATPDVTVEVGDKSAKPQETWQVAHVSQWGHYHQCNPSPCKKLRDRHKKGTGSVTE